MATYICMLHQQFNKNIAAGGHMMTQASAFRKRNDPPPPLLKPTAHQPHSIFARQKCGCASTASLHSSCRLGQPSWLNNFHAAAYIPVPDTGGANQQQRLLPTTLFCRSCHRHVAATSTGSGCINSRASCTASATAWNPTRCPGEEDAASSIKRSPSWS